MADEVNTCLSALMMCDDQQFGECLTAYDDNNCEMLIAEDYLNRIGVACFGEAEDFICDDGNAISGDYVCDGDADCEGGEDEESCEEE